MPRDTGKKINRNVIISADHCGFQEIPGEACFSYGVVEFWMGSYSFERSFSL